MSTHERIVEGDLTLYVDDEGGWTVADRGMWLPGVYDSKEAAVAASEKSDAILEYVLRPICMVDQGNRLITLADVQAAEEPKGPPR